jgi:hypothetical protein
MSSTIPEDISMREFAEWLNGFTPYQIVGQGGEARSCPIACFLVTQGFEDPFVDQDRTRFGDSSIGWGERPLVWNPMWVRHFVKKIDTHASYDGQGIQARTARRLLNEVIEEVGYDAL